MKDLEKAEKILEVVLNAISILSGHFEDILNLIHMFEEDPTNVNLDELEDRLEKLKKFNV